MCTRLQDKIPDTKVLSHAKMQRIYMMLQKHQLCWVGQMIRIPNMHIPKCIFYSELMIGKCSCIGQQKHFKDALKAAMMNFVINLNQWEDMTLECFH